MAAELWKKLSSFSGKNIKVFLWLCRQRAGQFNERQCPALAPPHLLLHADLEHTLDPLPHQAHLAPPSTNMALNRQLQSPETRNMLGFIVPMYQNQESPVHQRHIRLYETGGHSDLISLILCREWPLHFFLPCKPSHQLPV